jgi:hypothetical protein
LSGFDSILQTQKLQTTVTACRVVALIDGAAAKLHGDRWCWKSDVKSSRASAENRLATSVPGNLANILVAMGKLLLIL